LEAPCFESLARISAIPPMFEEHALYKALVPLFGVVHRK
jgi:hypothetical protein